MYDLLIRNVLVYDGLGGELFFVDVVIDDGVIIDMGCECGVVDCIINVDGVVLVFGFVDIYIYYDG